jgi:NDP-sugar pyrophosphorylase family protein
MTGACIIGPTSLGRDVTIASGALVSRSVVWRRSLIGERAVADRCILSDDTVLEADHRAFRAVVAGSAAQAPTARQVPPTVGQPVPAPAFRLSSDANRWLMSPPWARIWRRDAGLASISRF